MSLIKQLFGIAPTSDAEGEGYIPSPLGRLLGVDRTSGYQPADFGGTTPESWRELASVMK